MKERTVQENENLMLPNVATETQLRKWERRLLGSLTKEHAEKCKYFINMYKKK